MTFKNSNHLKTIFILFVLGLAFLFPVLSEAQTPVSFAWQPNGEPDLAGYRIFHRIAGGAYNYSDPVWEGSQTSCTITVANEEIRHYFVARAFDTEGLESQNSEEACLGCSTEPSDNCPNDPNKVEPGICGCGIPDIDTDGDGSLDCNDSCPDDPAKVYPGTCGCGIPDIDTDGDGTLDCNDNCPNDPDKINPGVSGCGFPEPNDDGNPEDSDTCPNDPNKTAPGICGCGTPDMDTDRDGTLDCNDSCPDDPNKTWPGANGCGFPEDSDNCPNDPNKDEPGICGCGVADFDTDEDGVWDCNDIDDDNDGIADTAEAKGPNQGDANWDDIPDSLQCNVGSIKTSDKKNYISIESPEGTCIGDFKRVDTLSSDEFPEDIAFVYGLYEYVVQDTGYGKSVIVTITLPQGASPDTFYIYGQTSENPIDHWYEFLDDGQTGAEIEENRITLYLTDGKRGDNTLTRNRMIISLGGPGYISDGTERDTNSGGDSTTDSASSGCFVSCLFQ
ncbi:choice-of-anchor U domain-containing protein [Thermodesulfobacteriota bacterium]